MFEKSYQIYLWLHLEDTNTVSQIWSHCPFVMSWWDYPNKPLPTFRIVSSDICEKGLLSQAKARVKIDHFSTQNKYIAICHVDYFNSGKQQLRLLPRSLTRRFDTSWKFKKIISRSKNWKNIQKWHKIKNFPRQSYSLAHFSRFDISKRNRFAFFKTSFFAFKTRLDEIKVGEKWKV